MEPSGGLSDGRAELRQAAIAICERHRPWHRGDDQKAPASQEKESDAEKTKLALAACFRLVKTHVNHAANLMHSKSILLATASGLTIFAMVQRAPGPVQKHGMARF